MSPVPAIDDEARGRLERWLAGALDLGGTRIVAARRLAGGAIQENIALEIEAEATTRALVLRMDAPSIVDASHGRLAEFALLRVAHAAGVRVPRPLAACRDISILGKPFHVMERLAGTALGHVLVRDDKWTGDRVALAVELGRELARIHRILPPQAGLEFLEQPADAPALAAIAAHRAWLDRRDLARPALEWTLRWLERHAPPRGALCLVHRDFRTGNYLVDDQGLVGILDWEFAGWGDPDEDIGWFCARCWRFGADEREAGGVGARADFYRGYEAESGRRIDAEAIAYWETMAHARWAVVALQQGERHRSGAEPSLNLALTGRIVAELDHEMLRRTAP